jgi:hypothetical protein
MFRLADWCSRVVLPTLLNSTGCYNQARSAISPFPVTDSDTARKACSYAVAAEYYAHSAAVYTAEALIAASNGDSNKVGVLVGRAVCDAAGWNVAITEGAETDPVGMFQILLGIN